MKDTCKILRTAIFNALTGAITQNSVTVPVYDETVGAASTSDLYIILSTQSESSQDTSEAFITQSSIDIEIIDRRGFSASKDDLDDVYQSMMEILIPTTTTIGITVPGTHQFLNAVRDSSNTQAVSISETQTILRRTTRLVFTIIQK